MLSKYTRKAFSTRAQDNLFRDYVVIGAGSAGCVMANRLSKDNSTILLEYGKSDKGHWDSWMIQMPSALTYVLKSSKYNFQYYTEPQKYLNNRRLHWPRGKILGGSSSHNAMVYIRGNAMDFNRWETEGAENWSYKDVLPYFRKAQTHELGANDYRGDSGGHYTSRGKTKNPLFEAFIESGVQSGYQYTDDVNGYQQEGFGFVDMNIKKGVRWNTSNGFLRSCDHKNLTRTEHVVNRIIFEGNKAIGVEILKGSQKEIIYANKEVILCAGSLNSPQILQLSGVGDAKHLDSLNIPVIQDNPLVGENLQDHIEVYMQYKCKQPITLYQYGSFTQKPIKKASAGIEWFMFNTGICASNHMESGGFIRSKAGIEHPDIQYHFIPGAVHGQMDMTPFEAYQVHAGTLRPRSRGYVKIRNTDPRQSPEIQPNLCEDPEDLEEMITTVELTREIMHQKGFDAYRGDAINYEKSDMKDRKSIGEWLKQHMESAYHASCTLPMGKVVDSEGRFKGLEQLRVVDASIMPSMVSGNLNASVVMMAEKIADNVLNQKEEPSKASYYVHPEWQTKQR